METMYLFTDCSVNNRLKIGFGSYLSTTELDHDIHSLKENIRSKRFVETSSTRLELETFLWAMSEHPTFKGKFLVYTDSQNLVGLPKRKDKIIQNKYNSSVGRPLNNTDLYKKFFKMIANVNCQIIKIKGHKPTKQKETLDKIFTLVDRASRVLLRNEGKYLKKI